MRFVTPVLFLAAAAYVAWYNAGHTDRTLVLPGMELLDASATGAARQGQLTVYVLAAFAAIFAVWDTVAWVRRRSAG